MLTVIRHTNSTEYYFKDLKDHIGGTFKRFFADIDAFNSKSSDSVNKLILDNLSVVFEFFDRMYTYTDFQDIKEYFKLHEINNFFVNLETNEIRNIKDFDADDFYEWLVFNGGTIEPDSIFTVLMYIYCKKYNTTFNIELDYGGKGEWHQIVYDRTKYYL